MQRLLKAALCASITLLPLAASAQNEEKNIDQTLQKCLDDPANGSTGGQDDCIDAATTQYDKLLNDRYRTLIRTSTADKQPLLRNTQHAWITARDSDRKLIDAVYATVQGTMYAPMNANDVMDLTATRAKTLGIYLTHKTEWPKPIPVSKDAVSNGIKLPSAGSTAQKAGCLTPATPTLKHDCATKLTPLYLQDLAAAENALRPELRAKGAAPLNASVAANKQFMQTESQWIDTLYAAPSDRETARLKLIIERVEQLDGYARMVGLR